MCGVCVAYHRLSFRIYGVSATYLWRDSRINGECSMYVLIVHTFAVDYVFRILWRSKKMPLLGTSHELCGASGDVFPHPLNRFILVFI